MPITYILPSTVINALFDNYWEMVKFIYFLKQASSVNLAQITQMKYNWYK